MIDLLPAALIALGGLAYACGVRRLHARGDHWPAVRVIATAAGLAALAAALLPPLATHDDDLRVHACQHLLLAMGAPGLLALGGPVTLALRALRTPARRRLLRVLSLRHVRLLTRPVVVLALDVGGMYAYYLTGLRDLSEQHAWLHVLVHLHMLTAGCLLAWVVAGADPLPGRPGVVGRLVLLAVAGAAHDVLAKLLYIRGWGSAAEILYYGGDAGEVLLAVAALAQWYARGGRALAREHRREAARHGVVGVHAMHRRL